MITLTENLTTKYTKNDLRIFVWSIFSVGLEGILNCLPKNVSSLKCPYRAQLGERRQTLEEMILFRIKPQRTKNKDKTTLQPLK